MTLTIRLNELEQRIEHKLESHDQAIAGVLHALRELKKPPEKPKHYIGFITPEGK